MINPRSALLSVTFTFLAMATVSAVFAFGAGPTPTFMAQVFFILLGLFLAGVFLMWRQGRSRDTRPCGCAHRPAKKEPKSY